MQPPFQEFPRWKIFIMHASFILAVLLTLSAFFSMAWCITRLQSALDSCRSLHSSSGLPYE